MIKFSLKSIILAAFAVTVLVVSFFVWTTFRNMQTVIEESRKINACSQVQHLVDVVHADLEAEEIAADNFIYSPNDSFLAAYTRAAAGLLSDTSLLNQINIHSPASQAETGLMKGLIAKKISLLREADSAYKSNEKAEPLSNLENKAREKGTLEKARLLLDELESRNRNMIMQSGAFQEKIAQSTSKQFLVLAAIFIALLTVLFSVISKGLEKRQRATEQLSYQASLIDSIPDAIISTDDKFRVTSWNKYAEEMYGYSAAETAGKPIGELIKLNLPEEQYKNNLTELQHKGSYKGEYTATKKNNDSLFILASVTVLKNSVGQITGYVAVHRDISERKKAEKKLQAFNIELEHQVQEKTTQISSILQRITDGFLALNSNLTFSFVNKQAGEILGHKPEEMIGKNIFKDFSGKASQAFNDACLNAYKKQQHCFLENYYSPSNVWIENDIYPSPDGLTIFFKDITFKKKAELALKESEEHYKRLIENMHAGVVVHDPDTSIVLCNQEASRLLGLPADALTNKKAGDSEWHFVSAEGKKLEVNEFPAMQVINGRRPVYNMIIGIDNTQNKSRMWVLVNAFPEFDMDGRLKQVVVTFVDITDRKKAEEELKYREDVLNMAQSIAKIGSWELDLQTNKLTWSKEQYRIFELEDYAGEDLCLEYRKKFKPKDLEQLDVLMKRSAATGESFTIDHHILCKNGTVKNILCIGESIRDADGKITTLKGTVQDISEMKKTEERLQKSYEQIRQLAAHLQNIREEERTIMAREIHDELGQQLTGLNMYISWLNKKVQPQDNEIKDKFLSTMELIEDTVKLVRKISTKLRPSMLDDLGLIAAIEWQSNEFEKRSGIKTEFVNVTGNLTIPGEITTGLFRIFQESLTNVARHAGATKIFSSLERKDNNLVLTIADDGKGFVLNEIGSKKTLGLFGMKERTMVMGGQYEIKTAPGKGTTVCISVPLAGGPVKEQI